MRDVTLKQLRSLAATLEQGTIAGAAQVLHVTPPAVSQQLRLLERSAGLPLMERTADGFRPTDAGRELAEATARIEAEVARCSRTLEAIASGSGGRVVFGAVSTAKYVAPQILASFWTQHPDIEVRLEIGNREETIALLEHGDVDLVMMGRPPDELDLEIEAIGDHPHVVIAPPGHPLTTRRGIAVDELTDHPFLVRERGSGTRQVFEELFRHRGIPVPGGMEMSSNETIKQAVIAGSGDGPHLGAHHRRRDGGRSARRPRHRRAAGHAQLAGGATVGPAHPPSDIRHVGLPRRARRRALPGTAHRCPDPGGSTWVMSGSAVRRRVPDAAGGISGTRRRPTGRRLGTRHRSWGKTMPSTHVGHARGGRGIRHRGAVALALLTIGGGTLAACSSTSATTPTSAGTSAASSSSGSGTSYRAPIPSSAFTSTTGLTSSTVTIGNVSTQSAGIFTGSVVGSEAYADYVNSTGGVDGRKIVVDAEDDQFTGAGNKQQTQNAVDKDFALVGSFSLEDSFGETVLAQNPDVPDVSTTLAPSLNQLPNTFSANPTGLGWPTGPLDYYKRLYPTQVLHTATLASTFPSALASWKLEQPVLKQAGYKVVYFSEVPLTQTDFTQNVVDMRSDGVQLIYIDQLPENYAGALLKALAQQNFHPVLVIGTASYSEALVSAAGGAANVDGSNLEMPNALFLGEDASQIPAVSTFLTWVQKASPGFKADYYTLAGWANTQLFVQALKAAGPHPTQGSVQEQLRRITSFNASNLLATTNPADRKQATCYLIAKVVNGQFVRSDDPPVDGPTNGYRCDGGFIPS